MSRAKQECNLRADFLSFHPAFRASQLNEFGPNRCVFIRVFLNAKSNENLRGCEPSLFDGYSFECSQQRFIRSGNALKAMLRPGWTAIQHRAGYFDIDE
jgi:hypothetical protein